MFVGGNDLPGVVGTLWAAYNGIADGGGLGANRRTPGQHLDYIWFGGGYGIKARAFSVAKQSVGWFIHLLGPSLR